MTLDSKRPDHLLSVSSVIIEYRYNYVGNGHWTLSKKIKKVYEIYKFFQALFVTQLETFNCFYNVGYRQIKRLADDQAHNSLAGRKKCVRISAGT